MTRSAASGTGPHTSGTPGLTMPAFSRAIDSSVYAELRLMIEIDRRDRGRNRRDDVSGIEPPAQADFEHGDLNAARGGTTRTPPPS